MKENLLKEIYGSLTDRISDQEGNGLSTFLNPYSYLVLRQSNLDLSAFNRIFIDGGLLARLLRTLTGKQLHRVSFDMTSAAPILLQQWSSAGKSVYFIGAKSAEIDAFMQTIRSAYPSLVVAGHRHGYFSSPEERRQVLEHIRQLAPDILIVGMGTPLQESFLLDAANHGWKGQGYTCGGFMHQTGTQLQYYPGWINRAGLRWAYRIYDEPKLARRYFLQYPVAIMYLLADALKLRFAR